MTRKEAGTAMFENLFSLKRYGSYRFGGSRAIGRAIPLAFAEAGADLVVFSGNKQPPELEKVTEEVRTMGRKALAVPTHVGKQEDGENLGQKTV